MHGPAVHEAGTIAGVESPPRPADRHLRRGPSGTLLVVAVAVFLLIIWALLAASLRLNEGKLVYALDDAYIHMAMAKNLAAHGVWGVTQFEFTHSSSSPLWTLLLALGFRAVGVVESLPFVLNLLLAILAIYAAHRILAARIGWASRGLPFGLLLAIILFAPLPVLVFTGQEHTLHLLATLVFVHLATRRLVVSRAERSPAESRAFWLITPLFAAIRYESLFVVLAVAILLVARRRWREAFLMSGLAALPIAIMGVIAMAEGWWFFPNSVLLKAALPRAGLASTLKTVTGYVALQRLVTNSHLLVLVLAALLFFIKRPHETESRLNRPLLFIFLLSTGLHLALAEVGWFYRYEAYLVALGLMAVGTAAVDRFRGGIGGVLGDWRRSPHWVALGLILLIALLALADRGGRATLETPRATANIREQQYQMGRFLREHYPGASVALNDIGAANFLGEIHCVDLAGIASMEVARHIRAGTGELAVRERLLQERGVAIAIVYPSWFQIPPTWIPCGSWTMRNNIVNGGVTVTLYALQESAEAGLLANLRSFAARLPATVLQHGRYGEPRESVDVSAR